ncbi:MAG: hypothetical protein JWP97_5772 [Labilithrix sp.]|nr:hypothetical protein [Labilithrix sp.]
MDLVCLDDLDEFASETDDELEQLAQDLEHRLLEEYGSNPDDEDRGVGLLSRLSGSDDPTKIGRLIEADFVKDVRVLACIAKVVLGGAGNGGAVAQLAIEVTTDDALLRLGYSVGADGTLTGGVAT